MKIQELRAGNLVIYEACTYEIMRIDVIGVEKLNVKAVNNDWGIEMCGIDEISPIEITPDVLRKNGFLVLNKALPELWIKDLGGYKYIRYHSGIKYMEFETIHSFHRVPWVVRYVHQLQNACTDFGVELKIKA